MQRDDRLQHLNRIVGLMQGLELFRDSQSCLDLAQHRCIGSLLACGGEKGLPRRQTCRDVVLVDVLDLGYLRKEEWIGGVLLVQRTQELKGAWGLALVPQINDVELVIRFPLKKFAA